MESSFGVVGHRVFQIILTLTARLEERTGYHCCNELFIGVTRISVALQIFYCLKDC